MSMELTHGDLKKPATAAAPLTKVAAMGAATLRAQIKEAIAALEGLSEAIVAENATTESLMEASEAVFDTLGATSLLVGNFLATVTLACSAARGEAQFRQTPEETDE